MTTFWLSFHDFDKSRQKQFLGVAVLPPGTRYITPDGKVYIR
jgi:hypothetical protein